MNDLEISLGFLSLAGAIIGLISAIISRKKVIEIRYANSSQYNNYRNDYEYNKKWYDKKIWLFVWILFFFPVGYYGLYKSRAVKTGWKFVIPIVHFFLLAMSSA